MNLKMMHECALAKTKKQDPKQHKKCNEFSGRPVKMHDCTRNFSLTTPEQACSVNIVMNQDYMTDRGKSPTNFKDVKGWQSACSTHMLEHCASLIYCKKKLLVNNEEIISIFPFKGQIHPATANERKKLTLQYLLKDQTCSRLEQLQPS